jgi:hypothetical protein
LSGITGGFLSISVFWYRSISRGGRYYLENQLEKVNGIDYERLTKSSDAILYLLTGVGICVSIQSCSFFNPNNKVTIENHLTKRNITFFRKKLDALSEDKKVINLLYIDQLNQDYDNPILRKELVALSTKKRFARCAKEIILKQTEVVRLMIKCFLLFYFKLFAQRINWIVACCYHVCSNVFYCFGLKCTPFNHHN